MLGYNYFEQQILNNGIPFRHQYIVGTPFVDKTTESTEEPTQEIDLTNVDIKSDFWRWFLIGGGALLAYYIIKKV